MFHSQVIFKSMTGPDDSMNGLIETCGMWCWLTNEVWFDYNANNIKTEMEAHHVMSHKKEAIKRSSKQLYTTNMHNTHDNV